MKCRPSPRDTFDSSFRISLNLFERSPCPSPAGSNPIKVLTVPCFILVYSVELKPYLHSKEGQITTAEAADCAQGQKIHPYSDTEISDLCAFQRFEQMFTNAPRPNAGPRHARNNGRQAYPISLQTTGLVNRDARYSYTDTPTELQRPNFQSSSSPVNSMIEESPIQPPDDRHSNMTAQTQSAQFPVEKVLVSSPVTSYSLGPPHEVHPALYAPLADPTKSSEEAQNTDIRQPADALPNKMRKQPTSPVYNSTYAQRDTEPKRVTSTGAHTLNLYNPDSLASPNIIIENHHPGQVSHPNAIVDPQWKHGLCEIDTLCCTGLFCPCVLYGRTQYRLSKKEQKQDPTDLLGYESVNGSCGIMAVACGLQCTYSASKNQGTISKVFQGSWPQSNERDSAGPIA